MTLENQIRGFFELASKNKEADREFEEIMSEIPVPYDILWDVKGRKGTLDTHTGYWKDEYCRTCRDNTCESCSCDPHLLLEADEFLAAIASNMNWQIANQQERLSLRNKQLRSLRKLVRK